MRDSKRDTDVYNSLLDSVGEGESGMIWENGIETCIISYMKWIATQVWCMIQDAWGWCTGMTQRDGMGREVGGGFRMGNTCIPVADSCWCMAKPTQYCKVINLQLKKKKRIYRWMKTEPLPALLPELLPAGPMPPLSTGLYWNRFDPSKPLRADLSPN